MVPQDFDTDSFFDELSIALSEGSSAELQAQQILIFGGNFSPTWQPVKNGW